MESTQQEVEPAVFFGPMSKEKSAEHERKLKRELDQARLALIHRLHTELSMLISERKSLKLCVVAIGIFIQLMFATSTDTIASKARLLLCWDRGQGPFAAFMLFGLGFAIAWLGLDFAVSISIIVHSQGESTDADVEALEAWRAAAGALCAVWILNLWVLLTEQRVRIIRFNQ